MKLYLMQHGEALSKATDPDRPLSEKGVSEVRGMVAMLAPQMPNLRILHSGKTRAQQTAQCFEYLLADGFVIESISGIRPNDSVEDFALHIQRRHENTLVVGHLPFMAKLVAYLLTGVSDHPVANYQPGSIVCLEQDPENHWSIQWMVRPELL